MKTNKKNEERRNLFTDDLTFALVMRDEEICKGMLARILPETEFGEIRLATKEHPLFSDEPLTVEQQKSLKLDLDAHGVRFDAYAKAEHMWAEIEMQTYTDDQIGKRSRYYHANMDMDYLEEGKPYKNLKTTYVIFICTFDYMGAGEPVYFFQSYDTNSGLYFDDFRYTIVLNTSCDPQKVPERLRPLFAYINDPNRVEDEFIQTIEDRVQKFNSREWRNKQMTLAHLMENAEERGRKEGRKEGLLEGEKRMKMLYKALKEVNRLEELSRAIEEEVYLAALFEEFNL